MTKRQYRDSLWCIQSPGLANPSSRYPDDAWYQNLEVVHAPQVQYPDAILPFRLGQYFEQIWSTWLTSQQDCRILAANLQVFEHARTVGEFDLIVAHKGQVEHWELAVKFYLGRGDTRSAANWFGTNSADCLATKLAKLDNHQLRLSLQPPGLRRLTERDITIAGVRGIIKGRLFYPARQFLQGELLAPIGINPRHERGWWMTQREFEDAGHWPFQYARLDKTHWLAPIAAGDLQSLRHSELCASLIQKEASHVACLQQGHEVSRGFIVDDGWLAQTQ